MNAVSSSSQSQASIAKQLDSEDGFILKALNVRFCIEWKRE